MISDFSLLTQKISQLTELAQTLRRENADLRVTLASVSTENADLVARMDTAHHRVQALLAQLPHVNEAIETNETNGDAAEPNDDEEAA